ncbi:MAG: tetratricopeptide repeat protein [Cyanobacteria bacterium REEB67]|nr:tetratricopeptide repeat protein [Cyanobacteria bacterium REEB67]
MQRRLWAFPLQLSLVLLAAAPQVALAEDDWEDNTKTGTEALKNGKYQEAEKAFLAARKEAEKSNQRYGHYATTLLNLGAVYDKTDRIAEGEKAYKEALAIYEKSYGTSSIEDSRSLQGWADLYRHHGKYNEAIPIYVRAQKIRDGLIPTAPDTAETLQGLAECYRKLNKNNDALPLLKRALDIRRVAFGATNTKVGKSLDLLSQAYVATGKYDMAVPIYKDLLSERETTYGIEDAKVALTLEDLAFACSKCDKQKKAEASYKRALAIREKLAKSDAPALNKCLKQYAEFLRANGKADEAAKLEARISDPTAKGATAVATGKAAAAAGANKAAAPAAAAPKSAPGKTASK